MARRDDALGMTGADTVIGTGVIVTGNLHSEGDIVIDGDLTGDIKAGGDVTIGVNAEVKAHISAANVTIAGAVTGNVNATGETTIKETGRLTGDVHSSGLAILPGGIFSGQNKILDAPQLELDPEEERTE